MNETRVTYNPPAATKGKYKHFMLKEIHEQPKAIGNALQNRVSSLTTNAKFGDFPLTNSELSNINRVVFIGMGTSLHAAMIGRLWMEAFAQIPSDVDNSSEFRYRNSLIDKHTLVVSVSQSGETADTIAAMKEVSAKGARQLTICNDEGAQTTRVADNTLLLHAGPEVAVAASKTFVCSLTVLGLLSLYIGKHRGVLNQKILSQHIETLLALPQNISNMLANHERYKKVASNVSKYSNCLFLGRGTHYPLALEGALKLKEVSYIHAEGYPAGEIKHGPISLIDREMPVVVIAPQDEFSKKMITTMNEVKSREGTIIAIGTEGDNRFSEITNNVIYIPSATSLTSPIIAAVPLQLLAYYVAVQRGYDVDQPRNLSKSVTVE